MKLVTDCLDANLKTKSQLFPAVMLEPSVRGFIVFSAFVTLDWVVLSAAQHLHKLRTPPANQLNQ